MMTPRKNIFLIPPKSFDIDICGFCNLSCRYCPEGQKLNQQPIKFMSFGDFVKIFNRLPADLTNVGLTNWSEPFLNKDIIKIIEYMKAKRPEVKIWVSSNGNAFRGDLAARTVLAGLDYLEITISGLTDAIYQEYHQKGKLERVFQAIDEITKTKQKENLTKPHLTINYLLFPYNVVNEDEIKNILKANLSRPELLDFVDGIRIVRGTMLGTQKALQRIANECPEAEKLFRYSTHFRTLCLQLFLNPAVRADGAVFPCCIAEYRDDLIMGNLHENSFLDIWHSEKYETFRSSFLSGQNPICNSCFLKYSPLPLFTLDHVGMRLKMNSKLFAQQILKNIFLADRSMLKNNLFRFWLQQRLNKKLRDS
ncbi:SPASM domain-containing protein [candidate division KSB1 bacterium]|nr:SPASM domain-containing protein [candidate division KSB1 bacterium]